MATFKRLQFCSYRHKQLSKLFINKESTANLQRIHSPEQVLKPRFCRYVGIRYLWRTREFTVGKNEFTSSSMHYDLELQEVSGRERSLQALPSATRWKQNKNVFVRLRRDEVYRSNRFVSSWNCNGVQHSIFATFIKLPVQQFNRQRVNYGVQTKTKHIITTHTHKHARAHVGIKKQQQTFHWDTLHKAVVSNTNPTVALWMEKKKSAASGYHVIFPPSSVCLPRVFANVLLELIKGCRERYFRGWVRGEWVEGN